MRQFTVMGDPRGQGRPRAGNGTIYKASEDKAWERTILTAYTAEHGDARPLTGPVRVTVEAALRAPSSKPRQVQDDMLTGRIRPCKRPDIDNIAKAVLDALNRAAWEDDRQVVELRALKRYGYHPRMVVTIEEVRA